MSDPRWESQVGVHSCDSYVRTNGLTNGDSPPNPERDGCLLSNAREISGFHPLVDSSAGPDACWPWMGSLNRPGGYGKASVVVDGRRVQQNASRAAYIAEHGPIPSDVFVLHNCDNPPCCNPAHLRAGTHQENMDDRRRRGRYARGNDYHSAIQISDETVAQIRAMYRRRSSAYGQHALAARFGVTRWTVQEIVTRTGRWAEDAA